MIWPTQTPYPRVPQTPKHKQITGEKTLSFTINVQMGGLISLSFSRAAPGLGWLTFNISKKIMSGKPLHIFMALS